MAKRITKAINYNYEPTMFNSGIPIYAYGGKMQYGFGSWLKDNWTAAISPITAIGGALTGKSATLLVQSISQEATTTVTVQGENSGVVETITIKAPTDSTSSVTADTLKQQAKNLPSGE